MKDHFKKNAATWDNPRKVKMSDTFVTIFKDLIDHQHFTHAIEVGCGTGLAGLQLIDYTDHIIMVDQSKSMLEQLKKKITQKNEHKISIHHGVLNEVKQSTDLIFTLMALHHIDHLSKFLNTVSQRLNPNGYFIVGDLITEDGTFHKSPVPHNGFNPEILAKQCENTGLKTLQYKIYNEINRPLPDGSFKNFFQFILIAQKPNK